jgi:hypothetical protein
MLSFRLVIVTAAAGVALWGLFSLLDTLREPGLLRTDKSTAIKGCELLDSAETRTVCPQLFCQKAVIEARLVSYKTRFAVTVDKEDGEGNRLIGGTMSGRAPDDPAACFACVLENSRVVAVKVTSRAELTNLASQDGEWELE